MQRKIDIDGAKFKKEVYKKNYNLSSLGVKLGYSHGYLNWWVRDDKLPLGLAYQIEAEIGIPIERYKKKEEPTVIEQPAQQAQASLTKQDLDNLYEVIYSAVHEAMKKALEG